MGRDDAEEQTDSEKDADVQDAANRRRHERTETVENVLSTVREDLGEQSYPVSSEELGAYYADDPLDLPNETESVGSAFDRLETSFEDSEAAFEALAAQYDENEKYAGEGGTVTRGPTRDEEDARTQQPGDLDEFDDSYAESEDDAKRRASEAQAEANDEENESET